MKVKELASRRILGAYELSRDCSLIQAVRTGKLYLCVEHWDRDRISGDCYRASLYLVDVQLADEARAILEQEEFGFEDYEAIERIAFAGEFVGKVADLPKSRRPNVVSLATV